MVGIGATFTAVLLATALLFPTKVERAQARLQARPWLCGGIGAAIWFTLGLMSLGLMAAPRPGAKLLGALLSFGLTCFLLVGSAGIARLMGERVNAMAEPLTPFAGLLRGSVIFSIALLFPFIGWFFLAPIAGLCALGAGVLAMFGRRQTKPAAQPVNKLDPLEDAKIHWEEAGVLR